MPAANILETLYKTHRVELSRKKDAALIRCLLALTLHGKNLANTTLFLLKQILSAYQQNADGLTYRHKLTLYTNQSDVLTFINAFIPQYNQRRAKQRQLKIDKATDKPKKDKNGKDKPPPEPFVAMHSYDPTIDKNTLYQVMDNLFLQALVAAWGAHQATQALVTQSDYEALTGEMAQRVIFGVRDDYKNGFQAIKASDNSRGRQQLPDYLPKDSHKTLSIDLTQKTNGKLTSLGDRQLYTDAAKTKLLDAEALAAYEAVDLNRWIAVLRAKYALPDSAQAMMLRIVPAKGGRIHVEVIFATEVATPADSYLGQLITAAKAGQLYTKKTGNFLELLTTKQRPAVQQLASALLQQRPASAPLVIAGADPGSTNLLTIAYAGPTPIRGKVLTGQRYNTTMRKFERQLDALKAKLTLPPIRALQKRQSEGETLTRQEWQLLRQAQADLYRDASYLALLHHQQAYVQDTLHRLSTAIVHDLQSKKVAILIIGKNVGWKQDCDMGKKNNRVFHAFPHARLITMIEYKAYEAGIAVLTTEESYTSKTSAMGNAPLATWGQEQALQELQESQEQLQQRSTSTQSHPIDPIDTTRKTTSMAAHSSVPHTPAQGRTSVHKHQRGGYRRSGKQRHQYVNRLADGSRRIMHADLNGAYNILRKVFTWFVFAAQRHSSKADVYGLLWGFDARHTKTGLRQLTA